MLNNRCCRYRRSNVAFDPRGAEQKITIIRGPMGSYFLRINGQIGVRGHRVG